MTDNAARKPAAAELVEAVWQNDAKAVKELLRRGANANETEVLGRSLLALAADHDYIEVARLLIESGADVNRDSVGMNPLMKAAYFGHMEIVQLLIGGGADVNATNAGGRSALIYAAYGNRTEVMRLLIDNGADVSICDKNGETAQKIAETHQRTEMIQLLKKAAEIQSRCTAGAKAHALAVKRQQSLKARAPKVIIIGGLKP